MMMLLGIVYLSYLVAEDLRKEVAYGTMMKVEKSSTANVGDGLMVDVGESSELDVMEGSTVIARERQMIELERFPLL